VAAKRAELTAYFAQHQEAIERGDRVVVYVDECFLLWGDLCGYAWGKRDARLTLSIGNPKARQTYYGALDAWSGMLHVASYPKAEGDATADFLVELMYRYKHAKITIIWDNARWHRGEAITRVLERVNAGLAPEDWRITLLAFAPHDPTQNPIEEVWREAKTELQAERLEATTFATVTETFETRLDRRVFDFPKLRMYAPSQPE
jgi:transposase